MQVTYLTPRMIVERYTEVISVSIIGVCVGTGLGDITTFTNNDNVRGQGVFDADDDRETMFKTRCCATMVSTTLGDSGGRTFYELRVGPRKYDGGECRDLECQEFLSPGT